MFLRSINYYFINLYCERKIVKYNVTIVLQFVHYEILLLCLMLIETLRTEITMQLNVCNLGRSKRMFLRYLDVDTCM